MIHRATHSARPLIVLGLAVALFSLFLFSPASADTLTFQPSVIDTYINYQEPNNNFGDFDGLFVVCCEEGVDLLRMYLKWNVASIPTGSIIINASLELYQDFRFPLSTAMTVTVRRVIGSWTEMGATWNNQPSTTSSGAVSTNVPQTTGVWVFWNITVIADDWINNGFANEGVRMHGATPGGFYGYNSREFATASLRPKLVIEYTPPFLETAFLVRHSGNLLTVVTEVNAVVEVPLLVENTGDINLNIIHVELVDHTAATVEETNLTNIAPGEDDTHTFIYAHGLSEGDYAWQLIATYEEPDPDVVEYWNFTLHVLGEGESILNFIVTPTLSPQNIPVDSSTTLHVAILNTGTIDTFFTLTVTSLDLQSSPDSTGLAIGAGASAFFEFTIFATSQGLFSLQLTVVPINATTGVPLGVALGFSFLLRVTESLSISTFSAVDIGLRDAILTGKINSLGGFESATVWFTLWKTNESVDSAAIYPTGKRVVGFVTDFRVWVGSLSEGTDYSYEFRMDVGPSDNPIRVFGGVVGFTTTTEFRDPITAIRNGFAEFLGIDSIIMGFLLGAIFVILTIVSVSWFVSDRLEGNAQLIAILIPAWSVSGIMWGIGYFPLWLLVTTIVVAVALIVGLPQFAQRSAGGGGGE